MGFFGKFSGHLNLANSNINQLATGHLKPTKLCVLVQLIYSIAGCKHIERYLNGILLQDKFCLHFFWFNIIWQHSKANIVVLFKLNNLDTYILYKAVRNIDTSIHVLGENNKMHCSWVQIWSAIRYFENELIPRLLST